jgi:hypothetical protein
MAPLWKAFSSIPPADVGRQTRGRKVKVVSDRIATATVSVVFRQDSGVALGMTCRVIWCQLPPRTRPLR